MWSWKSWATNDRTLGVFVGEFHINFTCYSTLCESSPVSCILRHDMGTMVVSDLKQLFLRSHVLFQSHCLSGYHSSDPFCSSLLYLTHKSAQRIILKFCLPPFLTSFGKKKAEWESNTFSTDAVIITEAKPFCPWFEVKGGGGGERKAPKDSPLLKAKIRSKSKVTIQFEQLSVRTKNPKIKVYPLKICKLSLRTTYGA